MTTSSFPGASTSSPAVAGETVRRSARPEADLLDHEYDGIREYDNPLPGWWVATFWATFFFGIGYLVYYATGHGMSVADSYESEMREVRAAQAQRSLGETVSEAGLERLKDDSALMADAKAIFGQRCMPCHGADGQGVIGPNLTDDYWLHGDSLLEIHHTISEGVPAKGMPAWKMQLSPVQVRELAAFVGSFHGKNLPGKAHEGVLGHSAAQ